MRVGGLLFAVLLAMALRTAHPRKSKRKGRSSGASITAQHSQGAQLLADRRLPEALESFDRAVALGDPVHRETHALRSKTLGLMGRLEEAVAEIDLALQMQMRPSDDGSWFADQWMMRGLLLKQLGQGHEEKAIASLVNAYQHSPDHGHSKPELLVSMCVMHEEMNAVIDATKRSDYLSNGLKYCDAAIASSAASVEEATDPKKAHKSRHALKAAYFNKGKILFHQDRVIEAWRNTDAAADLAAYHRSLDATEAEAKAAAVVSLTSQSQMHFLWPVPASEATFSPQALPFHISRQSDDLLSTPLWLARATGADMQTMNYHLRKAAEAMRAQDPQGKRVSNVGGWHSSKRRGAEFASFIQDVATQSDAEGDAAKTLYSWIIQELRNFVRDLQIPAERGEPFVSLKESWININGPGEPHARLRSLSLSRARSLSFVLLHVMNSASCSIATSVRGLQHGTQSSDQYFLWMLLHLFGLYG
jgi:tetratricopeptide (TPR) repeat protein